MNTRSKFRPLNRREFIKLLTAAGVGTALTSCKNQLPAAPAETPRQTPTETLRSTSTETPRQTPTETLRPMSTETPRSTPAETPRPTPTETPRPTPTLTPEQTYLAVARGSDPQAITRAAVAAIGGIERFVKSGHDVILKPNICVDYRSYEYGATTNPQVVAALVELCLGAGAARVRVMDTPFGGGPQSAYARSGIADAVTAVGGEMEIMNRAKFQKTAIPQGQDITAWSVYPDVLTADVLINIPIAKHHNLTRLSLGGKNLLGVVLRPNDLHFNLGQRVADLASLVRPTLTVVDAVRTLMHNGPTGGNLDDVRQRDTVIVSHDMVAADAYAATLFDLAGQDIAYVKAAAEMGLGTLDLSAIKIEEIAVS